MTASAAPPRAGRATYLFAVVEADEDVDAGAVTGPLDAALPPLSAVRDLRLVRVGAAAAVVGTLDPAHPLGRAADLRAHDAIVGALLTSGRTVLPMRFGSVLRDDAEVARELLGAHDFRAALEQVRGMVQFSVTVTYNLDVVLRQLVSAHPQITALRRPGEAAGGPDQLRLGELVVRALEQLRSREAPLLRAELAAAAVRLAPPGEVTQPEQVLRAAVLVQRSAQAELVTATERLAERSAGRLRVRLVGPVAPYDFVPEL
jgi:hypothetical protein